MSVHYVGTQTTFVHHEFAPGGGALSAQVGTWYSTNPAVGTITQGGVASWLAAGDTDIVFVVTGQNRFATFPVTVHSAIPATLTLTPSTVHLTPNSVQRVTVTAVDSLSNPITDLEIDSAVSSDETVATILELERIPGQPPQFVVLGVSVGGCTVTVFSGAVSAQNNIDVIAVVTEADADARYRQLSVIVPASDVAKDVPVAHGNVTGALPITWSRTARIHTLHLIGNVVLTLTGLAADEYAFFDVSQDTAGAYTFHIVLDGGSPPLRWDLGVEPDESIDIGVRDSFMLRNDVDIVSGGRTWQHVPTT